MARGPQVDIPWPRGPVSHAQPRGTRLGTTTPNLAEMRHGRSPFMDHDEIATRPTTVYNNYNKETLIFKIIFVYVRGVCEEKLRRISFYFIPQGFF